MFSKESFVPLSPFISPFHCEDIGSIGAGLVISFLLEVKAERITRDKDYN